MATVFCAGRDDGTLESCFPFLRERGHVISLVGGGGKTTLMGVLAEAYCARGMKAAAMTTTRILSPGRVARTMNDCRALWAAGEYAVCGEEAEAGKLRAPKEEMITALLCEADAVIVEADGAKRMAYKAPAAHEPMILPESDIVIGVIGAEVLGGRIDEVCFRPERVGALLGCRGSHLLTADDLAALLLSQEGTRKGVGERTYCVVVNKCDDEARLQNGLVIAQALFAQGHENVVLTRLK